MTEDWPPPELARQFQAEFEAGYKRLFTIGVLAGLEESPLRARVEAIYDQCIAEGLDDDATFDRIMDLSEGEP
ncbi:MAG: hypothetical protein ACM30G_15490 [Micromonosporaceae bacterium]